MKLHSHIADAAAMLLFAAGSLCAQDGTTTATNTNAVVSAVTTAAATVATAPAATNNVRTNAASTEEKPPALAAAVAAAAASGELPEPKVDGKSFEIIATRNIFNPSRRAPIIRGPTLPVVRTEYFTLNGTMTYESQGYAFFDGSSGQYRRTLGHSESIAGYKIASISNNLVKLSASGNQTITMTVGMQMRKQGDGPWKLETRGETPPDSGSSASSSEGSSASAEGGSDTTTVSPIFTGAQEDIVKKLMARRAEEEKGGGGGEKKDQ